MLNPENGPPCEHGRQHCLKCHGKKPSFFELVQVHECNGYAEVVIRDKNGQKVYAGNVELQDNPGAYL